MDIRSIYLKEFIREIQFRNRNPRDLKALSFLEEMSTNPVIELPEGEKLWRARVVAKGTSIGREKGFLGYGAKDSFVPPPETARDMRASYRYIPYLYVANDSQVALAEVRPRLLSQVSVATVAVRESLTLLDFTIQDKPRRMSDAKQNFFVDLSGLFAKPITADDEILDYIPTQFIAEFAKNLGYDGIAYTSSVMPQAAASTKNRFNAAIFAYEKCTPVRSNLVEVTRFQVIAKQVDEDVKRLELDGD